MTKWSSVHLLFCEGPHDAAFLNRLLKNHLGFKKIELKISELPYPIRDVLQQSFKTRAAGDLRLDLAKKFFLPDFLVVKDTTLGMVFNYGGSNRQVNMTSFLKNVFNLLNAPAFAGMGSAESPKYAYALFADADMHGKSGALALIRQDLAKIGDSAWLSSEWTAIDHSTAVMQKTNFGLTSAYIWKKSAEDNGTLEDIVLECLASNEGLKQTLQFLDDRFNWIPPPSASPEQVCASAAKRLKAAFCVEGQREKPGMSLGVVLDQTDLLQQKVIEKSPAVNDCLMFLRAWLI